jgi:photosystem II stability/assembly factor-like uncharacterized protein
VVVTLAIGACVAGTGVTLAGVGRWGLSSGPQERTVSALAIDPQNPRTVYAGVYKGGAFKSTDGGASWRPVGLKDLTVSKVTLDPSNPRTVYAGTGGGVFKSVHGGEPWASIAKGIIWSGARIVDALALDPHHPQIVYAGTTDHGLFKSTNGGTSWRAAGLKSTNGGAGWRSTGPKGPFSVASLALDPSSAQTLYAGTTLDADASYRGNNGGVFRSTDGGRSWQPFNEGLTNPNVLALAIDVTGKALYAGTQGGVFGFRYGR